MYRGRAARKLTGRAIRLFPWDEFQRCPYEDLKEPGRVHVDPFGNIHVCQGISIGNFFQEPLKEICAHYEPEADPVIGVLLEGGPAGLIREYSLPRGQGYADACHACFEARLALRSRFPSILGPDQMYASQA